VTRQVWDDQASSGQERRQLGEVPGRAAEAVHEQERRPVPAFERPDPHPAPLIPTLLEPLQENRRIRHPDRLSWADYELDGDKAGRVKKCPVLRREELETWPASA